MKHWKRLYKVLRSILFTTVLTVVGLYALLFIVISLPPVQNYIRERGEKELSNFLNSKVEIGKLQIFPFNEVRITDVVVYTPTGKKCAKIDNIGGAIRLWRLITEGKIEITYVELIGLDGKISQEKPNSPLNIDFIIKAFKPKEQNKKNNLDLKIYNIVIRKSKVSFDKLWVKENPNKECIDFAHIKIENLRADIALPQIKNEDFLIELRRLSLKERSGFEVDKLTFDTHITSTSLEVKNFLLRLPSSSFEIPRFELNYPSLKEINKSLSSNDIKIEITSPQLKLEDFKSFLPKLRSVDGIYKFKLNCNGNINQISLNNFNLSNLSSNLKLSIKGNFNNINNLKELQVRQLNIAGEWNSPSLQKIISPIVHNQTIDNYIAEAGNCTFECNSEIDLAAGELVTDFDFQSRLGEISLAVDGKSFKKNISDKFNLQDYLHHVSGNFDIDVTSLNIGEIFKKSKLGRGDFKLSGNVEKNNKNYNCDIDLDIFSILYDGKIFKDIEGNITKSGNDIQSYLVSENQNISFLLNNQISILEEGGYSLKGDLDINNIALSELGLANATEKFKLKGLVSYNVAGSEIDNLLGEIRLQDINIQSNKIDELNIEYLTLLAEKEDSLKRYELDSNFFKGYIQGDFKFSNLSNVIKGIIGKSVPSLNNYFPTKKSSDWAEYMFQIEPDEKIAKHLHLNVRPGVDVTINGNYYAALGKGSLNINAPFLIQGKNKLIKNTSVKVLLDELNGLSGEIQSNIPVKNDRANILAKFSSFNDNIFGDISWLFDKNKTGKGEFKVSANVSRNPLSNKLEVKADVIPTSFFLNGAEWKIDSSKLFYSEKYAKVNNFKIWHGNQYLFINGEASRNPEELLKVELKDINLDYIFNTLNINYVTFGGDATGEIEAKGLFDGNIDLHTNYLKVHNFSYNNTILGDADIASRWDKDQKMVAIDAKIKDGERSRVTVDGGIYVTRDSLSFDMSAEHVNLSLLKPFMVAFTSDVGGRASGELKLFGNFSDIDLTGKAFADTVFMKVDFTNVYYHATDSVYFNPGKIVIPPLKLYDKDGNSAMLQGYVKHRYFHDPEFKFELSQAKKILGFDTSAADNPIWYGKIYGSGGGTLSGQPGLVNLQLDMTTEANSQFTFAMEDTQVASEYTFLTFTDRGKSEEVIEEKDDFETLFLKNHNKKVEAEEKSLFLMDVRCTITDAATLNLIMDPKAGDKIVAHGSGPMQISYNTAEDAMQIYGKYTLSEGNYNFSLQDLILRDFKIKGGSNISFNGDVMKGILDIVAAYRVNTNLSDLDKSFSTDRDLNRTSVPVDALLKVNGEMTRPEISFDIALPTLTEDVERKVKSIISTEDQMSRQIIYLLALNRFYTPEYMGSASNSGAEIASVASTTVSTQLSNFIGQLTDKVSLMPSFRSEKGDFSDMEVDVALSSRLLNNRLLINGNFGYRDRTTSQTTFIGDFDIEYLLNKNGNLRLKAYNHFNDQYYYLQSALTTQGLGVIYTKEFDNPFKFLQRRKKKLIQLPADSTKIEKAK